MNINKNNSNQFKNERKYKSTYDNSKNHNSSQSNFFKQKNTYSFTEEQFPAFSVNNIKTNHLDVTKNFMGAVNTTIIENKPEIIEPGWLQITKNNDTGQIEKKYGKCIGCKQNASYNIEHETNLNSQMLTIIDKMVYNWSRYMQQYDEINGEGAYDTRFYYEISDTDLDEEEEDLDSYTEYEYEYEYEDEYY